MAQITVAIIQQHKRHPTSLQPRPLSGQVSRMAVLLLSAHPLLHQHLFTHTLLTHSLTFLQTCPRAQLVTASSFRSELSTMLIKGQWGVRPFAGFHGNQWANLISIPPKLVISPFPLLGAKNAAMSSPNFSHTRWGVAQGPCFRYVSSPCPPSLSWLWALSSI